ncbi:bifunctional DNA primase/polymerase [Agromyces laixinhei]|uniref:bifunctional DNA primase/polymerase n=1 Tax=Agromyces laixinhei TaxID=2585717 RepID=UPI0012EE7515|nr:bifunctional DNA primase/polymerase [Agromyces laixinhei]
MSIAEVLFTAARFRPLSTALALAAAGVPVFPCHPDGKRPLTPSGFHDASHDHDIVRAWWATWPTANLGMPTGPASGVDVVDVDISVSGTGFAALETARSAGLIDGEALRVRTPSGGLHLYFPADPDRPQRCWQSASAHVDFRGDGGYVVVPPSSLPIGGARTAYRVCALNSTTPHPIDAAALRQLIDPRAQVPSRPTGHGIAEPSRLAAWLSHLQEGERNHGLFWAACRLAEAGRPIKDIEDSLTAAAISVGLDEREIAITIRSASRRVGAQAPPPAARWREPEPPSGRANEAPCLR